MSSYIHILTIKMRQIIVSSYFILLIRLILASRLMTKTHLVILVHGLDGTSEDLGYLKRILESESSLAVLNTAVNEGSTRDGIINGGRRVADDISRILRESESMENYNIEYISFLGNSLGGLYARYAVMELFNEDTRLISGLQPLNFVTTASPWLGVRYHTYIDVPDFIKWVCRHGM